MKANLNNLPVAYNFQAVSFEKLENKSLLENLESVGNKDIEMNGRNKPDGKKKSPNPWLKVLIAAFGFSGVLAYAAGSTNFFGLVKALSPSVGRTSENEVGNYSGDYNESNSSFNTIENKLRSLINDLPSNAKENNITGKIIINKPEFLKENESTNHQGNSIHPPTEDFIKDIKDLTEYVRNGNALSDEKMRGYIQIIINYDLKYHRDFTGENSVSNTEKLRKLKRNRVGRSTKLDFGITSREVDAIVLTYLKWLQRAIKDGTPLEKIVKVSEDFKNGRFGSGVYNFSN